MSLQDIVSVFTWCATLIVPVYLIANRMPRRNNFAVRAVACVLTICGLYALMTFLINKYLSAIEYYPVGMLIGILKFLFMYVLSGISVKICFVCNWLSAVFCANIGYCIHHIGSQLGAIAENFLFKESYFVYRVHWSVVTVVSFILSALVTVAFYFIYVRKIKEKTEFVLTNKSQIFIAIFVIGISIFYNVFGVYYAFSCISIAELTGADTAMGYGSLMFVHFATMAIAFLALMLNCNIRDYKKLSGEMDDLKQILEESKQQYELEKKNIDLINIKCHDLKHQLGAMKGKIYEEQIEELKNVIEIYDSSVKTGNEALDVVLTQKMLYCSQHGIRLTFLLNGENYGFIPLHELYALFTNIIDNAIEAVEKLPEEKRKISITEHNVKGLITVHEENCFSGVLEIKDGLPVSAKSSTEHGFGIKSMKLIAEKYGGGVEINTEGDIFMLDIYFCNSEM